jgi:PilZ domain
MIERRKEPRQKSLLGGKVVFNRRHSVMDCVVKNISPHGALVVFPQVSLTPSEFMLHIPHRDETYSAKLIWRHHDRAGVILSENEAFEVPIDYAKRIRSLEVENRRLRKQIDPGSW